MDSREFNNNLPEIGKKANRKMFSKVYCYQELKESMTNNLSFFCNSTSVVPIGGEIFIECFSCMKDYCSSCLSACHAKWTCSREKREYEDDTVFEYSSTCHCSHNFNEKSPSETHLICFYTRFLSDYYEFENTDYRSNAQNRKSNQCYFCLQNCKNYSGLDKLRPKNTGEPENNFCECIDPRHFNLDLLDLINFFRSTYSRKAKKIIEYKTIISALKEGLISHFNDINDQEKKIKFIEFHLNIFSIHNIIHNGNFEISYEEEAKLIIDIVENLFNNQNLLQNREKINYGLTYIFHFYKKYFFSQIEMVTIENINLLDYRRRQQITRNNFNYLTELRSNSLFENMFSSEFLWKFFSKIPENKHFSIKLSNEENNIPFLIYFIKLFFESYCFFDINYKPIPSIFCNKVLFYKFQFKKNTNNYNILLRKYFDEVMYISQITHLDTLSSYESFSRILRLNTLSDTFYFKSNEGMNANLFKKFFRLMFYDEENYLLNTQNNKGNQCSTKYQKESNNIFKLINKESLHYLNCFNNKFLLEFIDELKNSHVKHLMKGEVKFSNNQRKISLHELDEEKSHRELVKKQIKKLIRKKDEDVLCGKVHFVFFKNISIQWIKETENENIVFKSHLDLILDKLDLNNVLRVIDNHENFTDYLFLRLKSSYNNNEANCIIDISKFLNEKKIINFSQISLRPFEKEIKFILHKIFNLEFYKTPDFSEHTNKWNLLLFLFFCNRDNSLFILSNVDFLNFLLHTKHNNNHKKGKLKSFLTNFLNYENIVVKENNLIWKLLYIAVKFFIHKLKELSHLKLLIIEKFINVIINFYSSQKNNQNGNNDHELLKSMNHCLVYYFFKITKKILINNDLSSCLPYNFNVNKFEIFEKINLIATTFFETEIEFNKLFASKFLVENLEGEIFIKDKENDKRSVQKSKDESEDYNVNENVELMNMGISVVNQKEKKIKRKIKHKKITIENIKLLLLDILASFNSTTDLNTYFQILNDNFQAFIEFFNTKQYYVTNEQELFDDIFKVEMILLRFLFNFLTVRVLDYSKIEIFSETNLTNEELRILRNYIINGKNLIDPVINFTDNPTLSKYLLSKMKIKVLDFVCNYIKDFDKNFYLKEKYNIVLGYFFMNYVSLFVKDLDLMRKNKNLFFVIEICIIKFAVIFFDEFTKFFSDGIKFENLTYRSCLDELEISEKDIFKIQSQKDGLFVNTKSYEKRMDDLKKYNTNFFGSNTNIGEYFRSFVSLDDRKYSKYSKLVNDFILRNLESKKRVKDYSKVLIIYLIEKYTSYEINIQSAKKKIGILKNNYNKNTGKDYSKESKELTSQLLFDFWCETNKKFSKHNSEDLNKLIKYLFNSLNICEEFENMNLDNMFSENFLKTINFFNNLLYHNPLDIQESLFNYFTEERMKILLRNVLKLNNYIIGISNYETNERLMSLSKIYFTLMDFFILIQEGSSNEKLSSYFFMDLTVAKEDKECDTGIKMTFEDINNLQTSGKNNSGLTIKNENNLITEDNQNYPIDELDSHLDEKVNIRFENINVKENRKLYLRNSKYLDLECSEKIKGLINDNNLIMFETHMENDLTIEPKNFKNKKISSHKNKKEFSHNKNNNFSNGDYKININFIDESNNNISNNKLKDEHISNIFNNLESIENEEAKEFNDSEQEGPNFEDDTTHIKNSNSKVKNSFFEKRNLKACFNKNGKDEVNHINQSVWIKFNGDFDNNNDHNVSTKKNLNEEDNLKNHFYYYTFLQLRDILKKINNIFQNEYEDFSHGSSRLILQFLYICRFLREYLEIEDSKENSKKRKS